MEEFIRRENLTLFKKRLKEQHRTDQEREVLKKLLAEEGAKERPARKR